MVPISAVKGEGIDELVEHAVHVARFDERPGRLDFCTLDGPGGALSIAASMASRASSRITRAARIPVRFAATKLVEGDELVIGPSPRQERARRLEHIISQMEEESGTDRRGARRHALLVHRGGVPGLRAKPHESREHLRSVAIDRVLTGRYTAIPMFLLIMAAVFWLTFSAVGAPLQGLMEQLVGAGISAIDDALTAFGTNPVVKSLVVDGVLAAWAACCPSYPSSWCCSCCYRFSRTRATWRALPLSWTRC